MNRYLFDHNTAERELGRLRMIEAAVDPETIRLLETAGIAPGWTCVEIGAGAGSIVEWLGPRVGPQGEVVAVDRKTAYLRRFSSSPYRVLEGDFLTLPINTKADLLHARYVLIHNKQDEDLLHKLRSTVKPGGLVLLEEPDFTSAHLLNRAGEAACRRVNEAICRMFTIAGLDPGYGLGLPRKVAAAGLTIVQMQAKLHLCPGASPIAKMMAESALVLHKEYTGTGIVSDQDIECYVRQARDPVYWSVYYSTISVLARAE
jgi:SAM-dependent methyltransferase